MGMINKSPSLAITTNYIPKNNMKLYLRCKNCFSVVKVPGYYKYTYFELQKKLRSKELDISCHSCKKKCDYTPSDIRATHNYILMFIFSLVALIISILLLIYTISNYWDKSFYSYIIIPNSFIIPWAIFFTYIKGEQKVIDGFNTRIRE